MIRSPGNISAEGAELIKEIWEINSWEFVGVSEPRKGAKDNDLSFNGICVFLTIIKLWLQGGCCC